MQKNNIFVKLKQLIYYTGCQLSANSPKCLTVNAFLNIKHSLNNLNLIAVILSTEQNNLGNSCLQ